MLWPISNKNIIKKNLQPHNIKLIINFHINIKKVRKAKMRKHGDMTYEGDADWEILIDDQALNESQVMTDGDRTLRARLRERHHATW